MSFLPLSSFPALNASLNATCAFLLLTGYFFIRNKKILAHKICMICAFIVSILFLISYLYYHADHGSTPFLRQGWIRLVYFSILISHTILAVVIVPLALITLYRAWKVQFDKHVKIARITFPIWLYVSITGVVIYWMLYR
jgi:uncharacterized membrane protein YozB (DUF420 family)